MTSISNQTIMRAINNSTDIYYHFFSYFVNGNTSSLDIINKLNAKQIRYFAKAFTHFYHRIIKSSELKKLTVSV